MMSVVFFGSTTDSVIVLESLSGVVEVVTQPPKPVGRKQVLTPTPVELWAQKHAIPVSYQQPTKNADLFVSASYGEKIPSELIGRTTHGGLNVHPSLLPRWRGADPVPWAILSGDKTTGVTIVTLSDRFDQGAIIAQKNIPITPHDTTPLLRARLFRMGAQLLLSAIEQKTFTGTPQPQHKEPYARKLTREDGFVPWNAIIHPQESSRLNRMFRALHPWPGLWTTYNGKRLKILEYGEGPTVVQLEGKKPVSWEQFVRAYQISS